MSKRLNRIASAALACVVAFSLAPVERAETAANAFGVGDSVAANCTTNFTVVKARMVTPSGDPVSRPVSSGLGQNEFTYSDGSPGVLSMNLVAEIEPDEVAELFSAEFRFVVDSIDGSEQTWAAAISGDYSSYGDEEVRMRKLERDVGPECYHEDLDWANPGCQSKDKCGP